jgi:hypothetical protein
VYREATNSPDGLDRLVFNFTCAAYDRLIEAVSYARIDSEGRPSIGAAAGDSLVEQSMRRFLTPLKNTGPRVPLRIPEFHIGEEAMARWDEAHFARHPYAREFHESRGKKTVH